MEDTRSGVGYSLFGAQTNKKMGISPNPPYSFSILLNSPITRLLLPHLSVVIPSENPLHPFWTSSIFIHLFPLSLFLCWFSSPNLNHVLISFVFLFQFTLSPMFSLFSSSSPNLRYVLTSSNPISFLSLKLLSLSWRILLSFLRISDLNHFHWWLCFHVLPLKHFSFHSLVSLTGFVFMCCLWNCSLSLVHCMARLTVTLISTLSLVHVYGNNL